MLYRMCSLLYNYSMFRKYVYNKITWLDFKHPHSSEIKEASQAYKIPDEIIKSFLTKNSDVEAYISGDYIFLSLPFPTLIKDSKTLTHVAGKTYIRFIIGKSFIITGREINSVAFRYASKRIRRPEKTNALEGTVASSSLEPMRVILSKMYEEIGNDLEKAQSHMIEASLIDPEHHKHYKDILAEQHKIWEAFDFLCKEFFINPETVAPLEKIMKKRLEADNHLDSLTVGKRKTDTAEVTDKSKKRRLALLALAAVVAVVVFLLV